MTEQEFRDLIQKMMDTQMAYFKARRDGRQGIAELDASKALERQVRAELKKKPSAQKTLWGDPMTLDDQDTI